VSLFKFASDVRLLGSGPRAGIGELVLPENEPGSSIMPGKVNPVICESVIMVACRVVGNDASITLGGFGGVGSLLELNVAMPLIADNLCESIELLANACDMFRSKCIEELELHKEAAQTVERSLMMVTSLAPVTLTANPLLISYPYIQIATAGTATASPLDECTLVHYAVSIGLGCGPGLGLRCIGPG
jgi:fumarate hydratase class II